LLAVTLLAALGGAALAAKDDTTLVSRASGAGAAGDEESTFSSISADGRYVAFTSTATNLSDEDSDELDPLLFVRSRVADIFVRDLLTERTTFVSRATGSTGGAADSSSFYLSISADGRYVAFSSMSLNLSVEDNDTPDPDSRAGGLSDVFVRDLETERTIFVSRASGARGAAGNGDSLSPSISADGRYVAFTSTATNLTGRARGPSGVFVRDLKRKRTIYVSRASGPRGRAGSGGSPSISADGRYVAFESAATNLSKEDNNGFGDVFVRDLETEHTIFVSRASGARGEAGDGTSSSPSISADGRYVAFTSAAPNLSGEEGGPSGVFVRDLKRKRTTLVSRASGTRGAASSGSSPSISADGRYVAFQSDANELSNEDSDSSSPFPPATDVFVRDRETAQTIFVSRASGAGGAAGDAFSSLPSISANGGSVSFSSAAANLSAEDNDPTLDLFLRDLLGPDVTPPRLSGLSMTRRRFAASVGARRRRSPRGTAFRYRLSELATVAINLERARPGRTGHIDAGTLRRPLRIGEITTPFSGRVGRRALRAGRYRAMLTAIDVAGNRSGLARTSFRILRR
jgi:Tol biopolymer transport system component